MFPLKATSWILIMISRDGDSGIYTLISYLLLAVQVCMEEKSLSMNVDKQKLQDSLN